MKKRINLLTSKKHFDVFAGYANNIKRYGTVIGVIFSVFFIYIIIQTIVIGKQAQDLAKKKQLYLSLLLEDKDIEANTRYFKGKQTQLNKFEKDDARFSSYYAVLYGILESSSPSATLDRIEIDKNRKTDFIVKFKEYASMISFLKYVESPEFLINFDELSMDSLSLSREVQKTIKSKTTQTKNYQLHFKGIFKELNDQGI